MSARVPQVVQGATVLRPGHLGPSTRPAALGPAETCLCGLKFTRYWAHRQTAHHQRWAQGDRRHRRSRVRPGHTRDAPPGDTLTTEQGAA